VKILKKSLALVVALCLVIVFVTSAVVALDDSDCCVVECFCVDCRCDDDCFCKQECDCPEAFCFACEAIVKRRRLQEQQAGVVAPYINVYSVFTKNVAKFDILRVCITSIIEDKVRMNN
jgi:hypothetical protein